jgi:ribonuclease BN (tRNA processing enzyme)
MKKNKYPIKWTNKNFSIKIFCSIPNIATGILLKAGDAHFIIDPGDGILRDLNKELNRNDILSISDVFVTHGHHDHVGGVWSLLTYLKVMDKKTPLVLHYPKGCLEIVHIYNAFQSVYRNNISYKIHLKEIDKITAFKSKKVLIQPFPVIHKEYLTDQVSTRQVPALGYKFTFDNTKICYGGDTAYCDDLAKQARNSDLAILEAGHDEDTPDEMHMTISEAKAIGESAKEYFLVHVPE